MTRRWNGKSYHGKGYDREVAGESNKRIQQIQDVVENFDLDEIPVDEPEAPKGIATLELVSKRWKSND